MSTPPSTTAAPGAWEPLRTPAFRSLWLGALASNLGLWVQNVAGSWDMTSLAASSPVWVSLLQTASSLPVLLVGLPAASLGDVLDRRKLLLGVSLAMSALSLVLAVLSWGGWLGPVSLLLLTFGLGAGSALAGPSWQSSLPALVPKPQLASAVTLSGVAINIARAVGPALGGIGIGLFGTAPVYLLNAVVFGVTVVQLARWRYQREASALPPEQVAGAVVAGLRYARHAPALQSVLVRALAFIFAGSALWALLPVVARRELGMGPLAFGGLLGCVGVGALAGATLLPRLRASLGTERLATLATLAYALSMVCLGLVRVLPVLYAALVLTGVAWIALMSGFNVAAASAAPGWVKSRALGLYLLTFQGGQALGSLAWGGVAARSSTQVALVAAAVLAVVGLLTALRYRLVATKGGEDTPWAAWPAPSTAFTPEHSAGPVEVRRQYTVAKADREEFLKLMRELEQVRRRDGAYAWALYEDVAQPGRFVEAFSVATWAEHLRQHHRITLADRALEERVRALGSPQAVEHLVEAWSLERLRRQGGALEQEEDEEPVAPSSAKV